MYTGGAEKMFRGFHFVLLESLAGGIVGIVRSGGDPMTRSRLLFLILAVFAVMAHVSAAVSETPKIEVFGGFAYAKSSELKDPKGFIASFGYNVNDYVGLVFDISHLKKDVKYQTFMGALQFSLRGKSSIVPFVRALVGYGRIESLSSGFAIGFGGGLDYHITRNIAIRILQADYIRQKGDISANVIRLGIGVVFLAK